MKSLPLWGNALTEKFDHPLGLIQFALDRMIPNWVPADNEKIIVDIGPGTKVNTMANIIIDYPEFNLDGHVTMEQRGGGHRGFARVVNPSGRDRLPFGDDEVGGIFAINVLEHLWDPRWLIDEAARVLAPGCPFTIFVPHPDSVMYKQDLDHKSRFVLDTWDNYLNSPYYEKGRTRPPLRVGFNMIMAVKEDNVGILTQLIKTA